MEAYVFDGDVLGTILFDIEEIEGPVLYREYSDQMQRTYSQNGGHASWTRSESTAQAFFSIGIVRGFRLSS